VWCNERLSRNPDNFVSNALATCRRPEPEIAISAQWKPARRVARAGQRMDSTDQIGACSSRSFASEYDQCPARAWACHREESGGTLERGGGRRLTPGKGSCFWLELQAA